MAQHSNFIGSTVKSRRIYFCIQAWVCHSLSFNPRDRNLWNQFELSRAADRQTEHKRNMDSKRVILTGRDRHVCPKLPVGLRCGRHAFIQGFRVFKPTAVKTESTIGQVLRRRNKPPGELMNSFINNLHPAGFYHFGKPRDFLIYGDWQKPC